MLFPEDGSTSAFFTIRLYGIIHIFGPNKIYLVPSTAWYADVLLLLHARRPRQYLTVSKSQERGVGGKRIFDDAGFSI